MTSFQNLAFQMRFFRNLFISQRISVKFNTVIKNWMLILFGLKVVLEKISNNLTQKSLFHVFGQTTLRNSVTMVTPKVPSDQKLFERVRYTLIRKVTKFQLPTPNSF